MKKIILFLLLLTAVVSNAQIKQVQEEESSLTEIGTISPLGQPMHMVCYKDEETNVYIFKYLDTEYKTLKQYEHFMFKDTGNDFETLYTTIIDGLKEKEKKSIKLELESNFVWINFVKSFGMTLVSFSSIEGKNESLHKGTSNMFTKKQIEKLFGKK
ncbi:hypothetical protein [Flavobacterium sp. NRK1]|uniref:hypothetical protein n=1 Tax=Flavobacterium sp. NRK1 TaxID=2954929 RepID=UPI002091E8B7|nr:hypothetical protein [Flavobacterium sp. NRK1]MCO6148755.1 hypothetical protein [Flavobacterium sp. NRK1]